METATSSTQPANAGRGWRLVQVAHRTETLRSDPPVPEGELDNIVLVMAVAFRIRGLAPVRP